MFFLTEFPKIILLYNYSPIIIPLFFSNFYCVNDNNVYNAYYEIILKNRVFPGHASVDFSSVPALLPLCTPSSSS